MTNVYKISHYYNIDNDISSFFLKSDLMPYSMLDILVTIQFKFEELVDESREIDTDDFINVLETFYPIKEVTNEYKKYLPQTKLDKDEWEMITLFTVEEIVDSEIKSVFPIFQIDLYSARESSCGEKYKELMLGKLQNSKEFISAIKKAKVAN